MPETVPTPEASETAWSLLDDGCRLLGLELDNAQLEAFRRLYDLLVEANRTTNLTRITSLDAFITGHLLDSLALCPHLPQGARLADIGSGAGFPSLPLAIARPDLQIVAVESTGKKARFIRDTAETLGLSRLTVIADRAELIGRKPPFRKGFDRVTARAVAALPVLLELCLPLLAPNGEFLAMKTEGRLPSELEAARNALGELNGRYLGLVESPFGELAADSLSGHVIARFGLVAPCPGRFPRSPGTPANSPL